MKRLFLTAGLTAVLSLAAFAATDAGPNFSGTWALDKAKSQGLDQRMQNAESVTCVITQDDKNISIEWKIAAGQPAAGAPAGGAGGGGGRGPAGPQTYTLDGKEVTTEGGGQMGGTSTRKATLDGNTLELTSIRAGSFNGNDFKATTTDKLSLSADGKTLTIVRHAESPRGTTDSTMVFNKQ
ncbi:MAG TPA: hypothetical protein VN696_00275 [Pyrinomonadaceae bacterium]|nr:hypothetical protein [Pyrinomonadaceae bacterium]